MDYNNASTFPAYEGQREDNGYRPQRQDNGYQGGGGYRQGGYQKQWNNNKGGGGFKGGFKRQEETDLTLYKPYVFAMNKECNDPNIKDKALRIAKKLEAEGYTLRLTVNSDVDELLMKEISKHELILPWKGFAEKESRFTWNSDRAKAVAKQFFPTYDAMKLPVQGFLARNARLIMGDKMNSPALFFVTWTEDGAESAKEKTARTGFSGHPIAIASSIGIPIYNLHREDAESRLTIHIESTKAPVVITQES